MKKQFLIPAALLLIFLIPMPVWQAQANSEPQNLSFFYTLSEIYLFSYFDDASLEVKDSVGTVIWSGTLDKGEHQHLTPGEGIYSAEGSKPYTVLVGAPKTDTVVGYYAVDCEGKGTSKELYTYICPPSYTGSKFIVFAYTDYTDVTITNVDTAATLWAGTLSDGEHFEQDLGTWSSPTPDWTDIFVQITSSEPVSALVYTDQGYHVPSSTGNFVGTLFYTFANYIGSWQNDLNVFGYYDETTVTIRNTETADIIWSGAINDGEVHSVGFRASTYVTVESDKDVAVSVDPFIGWTWNYHAQTYPADKTGTRVGTLFYTTARDLGYLYVFAYKDGTSVEVTDQLTGDLVWSGTLDKMEYHQIDTANTVYKVASSNYISMLEGYGRWGAEFAPLYYAVTRVIPVYVDIKPGSWPNPINIGSKGVFAVAICGTEDFDVTAIDPTTVKMYIEGIDEGIAPLRWSLEDVATPWTGDPCYGHALGGDGYLDLVFHFATQAVVTGLCLGDHVGETIPLIIMGNLYEDAGGTPIKGQDCVWILAPAPVRSNGRPLPG